jgi:hypothetical protein
MVYGALVEERSGGWIHQGLLGVRRLVPQHLDRSEMHGASFAQRCRPIDHLANRRVREAEGRDPRETSAVSDAAAWGPYEIV